jgi:hypothetical protein
LDPNFVKEIGLLFLLPQLLKEVLVLLAGTRERKLTPMLEEYFVYSKASLTTLVKD